MAARTRGVDATSRAVLDLLAVVERPLPLADLAALTGLPLERLAAAGRPGWKARPPALAMYYGGRTGRFTMATARPGDLAVPVGSDFRLEKAPGRS